MEGEEAAPAAAAEFESLDALRKAARRAREAGLSNLDAYSPFPDDELMDELGVPPSRLPLAILLGGICGGLGGYLMQWYISVVSYPIDVGGRPLDSWPAFVVPCFELTVLFAALTAFIGVLWQCGLPQPHHRLFALPEFDRASRDRFFLYAEGEDARRELSRLGALEVHDVPS